MDPAAPLARLELGEEGDRAGSMDAQTHAGVGGGGDESIETEHLSANVIGAVSLPRRRRRGALAGAAAVREGRFATRWIHQGYLEPQVCTAWLDEDGALVIETSTQALFGTRNEVAKALGIPSAHASGSSRRRSAARSAGSGRCSTRSSPLPRSSSSRPVRLERQPRRGLRRRRTRASRSSRRSGSARTPRATSSASRPASSPTPGAFDEGTAESLAGVLVAGPYAWPAYDVRAYGVRTNRFGVGAYRAPSGAADGVRARDAHRRARRSTSTSTRSSSGAGTSSPRATRWSTARRGRSTAPREVLDALEASPVWRDRGNGAGRRGRRRRARLLARRNERGRGGVPGLARRERAGPDRRRRHVRRRRRVPGDRRRDPRGRPGRRPDRDPRLRTRRRPRPGAAAAPSRTPPGARSGTPPKAAAQRLLEAAALAAGDRGRGPGARRRRRPAARDAGQVHPDREARARQRPGRPAADRGPRPRARTPGLAPSVAGHVVRVRVDRDTGDVAGARGPRRPGRRPRAQSGARRPGSSTARPRRSSAGRSSRSSSMATDGELLSGTFLDYALPRVDDVGELLTTNVEVPAPEGPLGAKGIGEAPVIAGRGRRRQRGRRGDGPAPARPADVAAARLAGAAAMDDVQRWRRRPPAPRSAARAVRRARPTTLDRLARGARRAGATGRARSSRPSGRARRLAPPT